MTTPDTLPKYKWTVMVLMGGDNNLKDKCIDDLKEMKRVGSTPDVAIVAQYDAKDAEPQRFKITKQDEDGVLGNDVIEASRKLNDNTGDPRTLSAFAIWAMENFSAEHYLLVLYGHASGVVGDTPTTLLLPVFRRFNRFSRCRRFRGRRNKAGARPQRVIALEQKPAGILFDENPNDVLDDIELQTALNTITEKTKRRIDVLGMDACLMGMAEVGYQVRNSVDILIASAGTVPVASWPYHRILTELAENPNLTPEQLSRRIVTLYVKSYSDYSGVSVDQSAFDLRLCERLKDGVAKLRRLLVKKLPDRDFRNSLLITQLQAQSYNDDTYIDLFDFCDVLIKNCQPLNQDKRLDPIIETCQEIIQTIGDKPFSEEGERLLVKENSGPTGFVLAAANNQGDDVEFSRGLSIYFPWDIPDEEGMSPYSMLEFAKDTKWDEFLADFDSQSERPA